MSSNRNYSRQSKSSSSKYSKKNKARTKTSLPGSLRSPNSEIQNRIDEALNDPELLSLGVVEAMRRHKLSHARITDIRRLCMKNLLENGDGSKALSIIDAKQESRLRRRLVRAERRYPDVHRRILTEKNMSKIARDYSVTPECIIQFRNRFQDYVSVCGRTPEEVQGEIEEEAEV